MSDGRWSGSATSWAWTRPGSRLRDVPGDRERGPRLYAALAAEPFLCETCGRLHPLQEHRACRSADRARPNARPA